MTELHRLADIIKELGEQRAHHIERSGEVSGELAVKMEEARDAGMSEAELARIAGVSRLTVRSWLGKGK